MRCPNCMKLDFAHNTAGFLGMVIEDDRLCEIIEGEKHTLIKGDVALIQAYMKGTLLERQRQEGKS